MTTIDMSKMKYAIVNAKDESNVYAVCEDHGDALDVLSHMHSTRLWKVIPITPPAPKYPKADVPTHCVTSTLSGLIFGLGTETECLDSVAGDKTRIRTCDHWFAKEGGGQ